MIKFDDWIVYLETGAHHTEGIHKAIEDIEARGKRTPGEIAALERLCKRLLAATLDQYVGARPYDLIEEEWNEPAVRSVRDQLHSLRELAGERSLNLENWLRDLRVACEEYLTAMRWFKRKIEF